MRTISTKKFAFLDNDVSSSVYDEQVQYSSICYLYVNGWSFYGKFYSCFACCDVQLAMCGILMEIA
jgi:hypothetical protein